ncbi:unnamed protein product [Closterium sp. NIES-65]|nr:unnamed protein product [Closterium sp. NIES-65]
MRENLAYLLDQRLYESAEILGSFLVSAAAPGSDVPAISRAENLVLYADALFGRQEFRRALNLYRQAQQLCKVAGHAGGSSRTVPGSPATVAGTVASAGLGTPAQSGGYSAGGVGAGGGGTGGGSGGVGRYGGLGQSGGGSGIGGGGGGGRVGVGGGMSMGCLPMVSGGACVGGAGGGGGGVVGGMGGGGASMVALDTDVGKAEVRLRVAECYVALKEVKPALTELEAVPHRLRSLRLNLLLARLYRSSSYDRAALTAYKECLRQCPFAMEAVTAVGQLGLSAKETCALLPQQEPLPCTPSSRGGSKAGATGEVHESCKWLQKYVEAQAHRAANENAACVDEYQQLLTRFPSNVHLHLYMGQVEASQGRNEEAMLHYQKARTLDPFNVACMDDYALLLLSRRSPSASSALSLPNLQVDASVGGGGAAGGAGGAGGAELRRLTAEMVGVGAGRVEAWVVAAALWMSRGERGRRGVCMRTWRMYEDVAAVFRDPIFVRLPSLSRSSSPPHAPHLPSSPHPSTPRLFDGTTTTFQLSPILLYAPISPILLYAPISPILLCAPILSSYLPVLPPSPSLLSCPLPPHVHPQALQLDDHHFPALLTRLPPLAFALLPPFPPVPPPPTPSRLPPPCVRPQALQLDDHHFPALLAKVHLRHPPHPSLPPQPPHPSTLPNLPTLPTLPTLLSLPTLPSLLPLPTLQSLSFPHLLILSSPRYFDMNCHATHNANSLSLHAMCTCWFSDFFNASVPFEDSQKPTPSLFMPCALVGSSNFSMHPSLLRLLSSPLRPHQDAIVLQAERSLSAAGRFQDIPPLCLPPRLLPPLPPNPPSGRHCAAGEEVTGTAPGTAALCPLAVAPSLLPSRLLVSAHLLSCLASPPRASTPFLFPVSPTCLFPSAILLQAESSASAAVAQISSSRVTPPNPHSPPRPHHLRSPSVCHSAAGGEVRVSSSGVFTYPPLRSPPASPWRHPSTSRAVRASSSGPKAKHSPQAFVQIHPTLLHPTPPHSTPLHTSPPHLSLPPPNPHQGAILLQTERAESAAVASAAAAIFRRAYTQKQDLRVFQGEGVALGEGRMGKGEGCGGKKGGWRWVCVGEEEEVKGELTHRSRTCGCSKVRGGGWEGGCVGEEGEKEAYTKAAAIFWRACTQKQDLRVFQGGYRGGKCGGSAGSRGGDEWGLHPDSSHFLEGINTEKKQDLRVFQAYLRIPKLKEAIAAAREAVKAFPNSASALSLLGEVYLQHGDSRDKARKVFEAALRMDGRCGAAVTGLADAHSMDGRHSAAVDVLERHLAVDAADWIHVKLGFVHMAANRLPDALHHLQTALSINPTNENAKRGLNRIDRLLKCMANTCLSYHCSQGGDGDDEEEETSTQYGTGSPLFE